jgi:hypothetical protein
MAGDGKVKSLFDEASKGKKLKLGGDHPHTQQSLNDLIDLYKAWNRPEKAQERRAKLPQTEAVRE